MLKVFFFAIFIAFSAAQYKDEVRSGLHYATKFLFPHYRDKLVKIGEKLGNPALSDRLPKIQKPEVTSSRSCDQCRLFIDVVLYALESGATWPDMEPVIYDICLEVCEDSGWNGQLICPGILRNHVPHYVYVFNYTRWNTDEVCTSLLACRPQDVAPPVQAQSILPEIPSHVKNWLCQKTALASNIFKTASVNKRETRYIRQLQGEKETKKEEKVDRRTPPRSNKVKVLQLADIHIDEKYETGSVVDCALPLCCRKDYNGTGSARHWGEYTCNIPKRTIESFMRQLSALKPDVIMYVGDSPANAVWEETKAIQWRGNKWVADAFRRFFPGVKAYTTIGNHENFPVNQYYIPGPIVPTDELNRKMSEWYKDLSGFGAEQEASLRAGGYYTALNRAGLRVISYNTNYGTNMNIYNLLNERREHDGFFKMVDFLNTTFRAARAAGEKVLLIGHHPPGKSMVYYANPVWEIFRQNSDIIVVHVSGHSHSDIFKVSRDPSNGAARNLEFSGGTMGTRTNKNPMARFFELDTNTFELQDAVQYYMELKNSSAGAEPPIQIQYRFKSEYNLPNMSSAAFLDLLNRFITDEPLYRKFLDNANGKAIPVIHACDQDCRRKQACQASSVLVEETRKCNELDPVTSSFKDPFVLDVVQSSAAAPVVAMVALLGVGLRALL